jgi:predicted nucleotidyltransferase
MRYAARAAMAAQSQSSTGLTKRLGVNAEALSSLCRRWRIKELSLFGSVLRDDFRPDSDIDVLVTFEHDAEHSLLDVIALQHEMEDLLGRPVDLVERRALRNPFRRREILETHQVLYAA